MNQEKSYHDATVTTEGDTLYWKVRGQGKPVLFIAPAGGNGDGYLPVARILSDEYRIITYDRRANTRSTRNFPGSFDIRQQSRDALAVLAAAGEVSAAVVGNSSGAVIALDMAAAYPQAVALAIIHEAAIPTVLSEPEASKWKGFFQSCYDLGRRKGASYGAMRFFFNVELPAVSLMRDTLKVLRYMKEEPPTLPVERIPSKEGTEVLIFEELLPITSFVPDWQALHDISSRVFFGCGEYGVKRNAWYARTAKAMADRLGSPLVTFPGHHGEFMGKGAKAWAQAVRDTLHKAGW